ncbi:MAG: hypothetical protein M3Q65_08250 [Chloroflexota bacterium]|nr:hypothetical protein [Chloroflexota bacterium]
MVDAETLARGAVEALLDDESLRGDLTDDGFGPLLAWATGALTADAREIAASAADETAARARMVEAGRAVKAVLTAAVEAAQSEGRDDLQALLRQPLLAGNGDARTRVARAGLQFGDDPDANAALLARALRGRRP